MRLNERREGNNAEDRRRTGRGAKAGVGGLGVIVVITLMTFMSDGNLGDMVGSVVQQGALNGLQRERAPQQREFTAGKEELTKFSRQVLMGTEDVWTKVFQQMERKYAPPMLILYTDDTQSACGSATSAIGPFYCSDGQELYPDLSFFATMRHQLGASDDFTCAYVIAHEVDHYVEHLLGILSEGCSMMSCMSRAEASRVSVRLELLANYYAGIQAHYDDAEYNSLEDSDIEGAIGYAERIGDNYLQEEAQGCSQPELSTYGTDTRRMKWLKMEIKEDDISINTFDANESDL